MKYELRDYQVKGYNQLIEKIKQGNKKIIYWAATGAGKGLCMPHLVNSALLKNKKVLTVMRRRELIFQTDKNYQNYYGIKSGIIMGNEKGFNKSLNSQICSIDTIRSRLNKLEFLKEFDLIIIDECHDTTSPTYQKFFEFMGDKIFIGFTATPFRTGNKPLDFWETYVQPIKPFELKDQGFLVPFRVFAPKLMDLTGIKKLSTGDYNNKQLFAMVSESKIVGDIVETYKKYGRPPAVLFGVNKAHSALMAHAFREANISATHIDESHNSDERQKAVHDLENGTISILTNVNIFSTGINIPSIKTIILARPTTSEILYVQQVGRGSRTYPGKEYCIVLDHAGNSINRFGLPYDERDAELGSGTTKKSSEKSKQISKQCKECFAILEMSFSVCPYCDAPLKTEREIKLESGELTEITETPPHVEFQKYKTELSRLNAVGLQRNWKPNAKYFILYERFGDSIMKFEKELGIPSWIPKLAKNKNGEISTASGKVATNKVAFTKSDSWN